MKIGQKLTLAFLGVALLIGVAGYVSLNTGQEALQESIGESSVSLVAGILSNIDRAIYNKIEEFQIYAENSEVQKVTKESNEEFEKLDDIQRFIERKDREWTSVPQKTVTDFMRESANNEPAKELKRRLKFYEEKYGYRVFGEVFITNKYGANVAQTGKATDYYQADEQWWQITKKDGLYVADVQYDKSADVYSTDIGIRIDDEDGNFAGVIKAVLNIEGVIDIMKKAKGTSPYETTGLKLFDAKGRMIFSTEGDIQSFEDVLDGKICGHITGNVGHILKIGELGEGKELFAYAYSKGYRDYKPLGWVLAIEYETEEIFAPVAELKNIMLIVSLTITMVAVLIGLSVSRTISKPIKKLRNAAVELSKGKFDATIEIKSEDEIGELANSFSRMTWHLKKMVDNLNGEVAERKRAEETLRGSENKYRTLLKNIPQKIFYKDLNSVYVLCNESYAKDLGIEPVQIRGATDYSFYPKDLADKYVADDKRIIQSGKSEVMEEKYVKDGQGYVVQTCKSPVKDERGNVIGVFGIFWDITESKKAEYAMEKLNKDLELTIQSLNRSNKELQEFAYIAAHDLKAPLRAVGTLADWLSTDYSDKFDEQGKEKVELLVGRAKRIDRLIDSILKYSEVGNIGQKKQKVDLNLLLSKIIYKIKPPDNIEITIENKLPTIMCDKKRIVQVFHNLLSNAVRYMDKPKGQIKVGCSEENGFWKFSVSDNGHGIEQKYFEKIFKIFQTLSTRDEVEAVGIGLSLAKKIVELYGGRIWVHSEPGQGSTFYFTLPKQEMRVKDELCEANTAC